MPSPIVKAVRKDSAVHVSLSSDSLVKQRGTDGLVPTRSFNPSNMTTYSWSDELFTA
jgi:hypothetical protein